MRRCFWLASWLICSMLAVPLDGGAQSPSEPPMTGQRQLDPLRLPFGPDPSTRSLESTQRLREDLRDQDLRVDPDPNRRMFRPKQPEPGYSEVRPYSGAEVPARVRPLRPLP